MSANNASLWDNHFIKTRYRYMRVDRATGNETEVVRAVKGGTITRNDDTTIKESAEATLIEDYDFGSDLLRIYITVTLADGTVLENALGTFLPVVPSAVVAGKYKKRELKLYGRLQELVDDSFATGYTVSKGTNAVQAAVKIIQDAGLEVVADDSDYCVSTARHYGIKSEQSNSDTADTKLGAINDLMDLAGFRSAYTDTMGRVILEKYNKPADIAPSWNFIEGPDSHFEKSATETYDYTEAANHVVVRYTDSSTGAMVIGEAWDKDPNSELSTVSRGRTITKAYDYNDLPSGSTAAARQTYANNRAQTLLNTAQAIVYKVNITAAYTPTRIMQTVNFDYPSASISGKFQMRTQKLSLTGGCPTAIELKQYTRSTNRGGIN